MSVQPDHTTLLQAVATFLVDEVQPKMEADKGAQFRVLIAANLLAVVSGELASASEREGAELKRLTSLFADSSGQSIEQLRERLLNRVRQPDLPDEQFTQLLLLLKKDAEETLAVTNPRFVID